MSADNWTRCPRCHHGNTLREDWELGIADAKFYVSYRSVCKGCGFKFRFEHEEKVK